MSIILKVDGFESHMTDRILPIAKEWQNRPLEKKYAVVFMDAVHFHVRQDNQTVKKAVYVAIGIKLNGRKEVPGMWIAVTRVQSTGWVF